MIKDNSNLQILFFDIIFLSLLVLICPIANIFFSNLINETVFGPHLYHNNQKIGELPTLIFFVLSCILFLAYKKNKEKICKLDLLIIIFLIFFITFFKSYNFFELNFFLYPIFLFFFFFDFSFYKNLFKFSVIKELEEVKINYIYILFIIFSLFFVVTAWSSSRLYYFSLHLSEYTLIPHFYNSEMENIFNYFPRHGLFEIFLGNLFYRFDLSPIYNGYFSEFIIKSTGILDLLSILFWIHISKFKNSIKILFVFFSLFYVFIFWQTGTFIFLMTFPFFLYMNINLSKFCKPLFLGFVVTTIFFLRFDYGLFSIIGIGVIYFYHFLNNKKSIYELLIYCFSILLSIFIILLLLNSNIFEFYVFLKVLAKNTAVWGWPDIYQSNTPLIFLMAFLIAYFIFEKIRSIKISDKDLYLIALYCCNFIILTGRSDGHIYNAIILFNIITIFSLFDNPQIYGNISIKSNIKKNYQAIKVIFLIAAVTFTFEIFNKTIRFSSINFYDAINNLKNFPSKQQLGPFSNDIRNILNNQVKNGEYKNKTTFLFLMPFEYVLFDTKPLGKFADAYHASQSIEHDYLFDDIKESQLIVIRESNLDNVPDRVRFKKYIKYIRDNFFLFYNDGVYKIYKKTPDTQQK